MQIKNKIKFGMGVFLFFTIESNAFWGNYWSDQWNTKHIGTKGNDVLFGGIRNDTFEGKGGNDTFFGGFGSDKVVLKKRPIDYIYTNYGFYTLIKDKNNGDINKLFSIEKIRFKGNRKTYSKSKLLNNLLLVSRKDIQLFGDTQNNRIVGMQLSTMKQVFDFPLDGELIYSADAVTNDKSYAYGRDTHKLFVLNRDAEGTISHTKTITMPFAPRTGAKNNRLGLTLITGTDKPMFSLIDVKTDTIVATGGRDEFTRFDNSNHGSHWATGHGSWLTDRHFVYSDREARELIAYEINISNLSIKEISRIKTNSSVHAVIGKLNNNRKTYYAITEGSDESKPKLIELLLQNNKLIVKREVEMSGDDPKIMKSHHAIELADGRHIYMGSAEGTLNVIDKLQMKVIKTIKTGKGTGHSTLIPSKHLAIVTNHNDTYVTVINTLTHTKIKDITVSGPQINNTALQSHTARLSPDNRYYYNFATDNGTYFRIDLWRLVVDKQIYTGGTPKQASQPTEINLISEN